MSEVFQCTWGNHPHWHVSRICLKVTLMVLLCYALYGMRRSPWVVGDAITGSLLTSTCKPHSCNRGTPWAHWTKKMIALVSLIKLSRIFPFVRKKPSPKPFKPISLSCYSPTGVRAKRIFLHCSFDGITNLTKTMTLAKLPPRTVSTLKHAPVRKRIPFKYHAKGGILTTEVTDYHLQSTNSQRRYLRRGSKTPAMLGLISWGTFQSLDCRDDVAADSNELSFIVPSRRHSLTSLVVNQLQLASICDDRDPVLSHIRLPCSAPPTE